MADTDKTDGSLFGRIARRMDPLESDEDFDAHDKARTKYRLAAGIDAARVLQHLPPLTVGMTDVDRERLKRDYTEMLANLTKLDTQLKSEAAKTARNKQTMWANSLGQILKYDAERDATQGRTISSAHAATAEEVKALGVAERLEGTATLSDDILEKHSRAFYDLSLQVKDGKVIDNAEYEKQLTAILKNTPDDRMITGIVEKLADISGVDAMGYMQKMHTLFPPSTAMYKMLTARFRAGNIAYREAEVKQEKITARSIEAMDTLNQRTPGSEPWVAEYMKLAVLGMSGLVVDDKLAKAMGISPEGYKSLQSGTDNFVVGKDGKPILESSKTETKVQSDPYIEDTRDRILSAIEGLMDGSTPYFVQIKKNMMASPAFSVFKKQHGITDNDTAWKFWGEVARQHARTAKKDSLVSMDRDILSGKAKVGVLPEMAARVRSGIRDLFGGKKEEVVPTTPLLPTDTVEATTPTAQVPGATPTAQVPGATPTVPGAPGATPTASESNPSAAVVSGSKASAPVVETAGSAKPLDEKSKEYRIVNDPSNTDFIYRQYADGRLEMIGSPKDKKVSPQNPKAITGSGKTKAEGVLGAYQKETTLEERKRAATMNSLDLEDAQPSQTLAQRLQATEDRKIGIAKQGEESPLSAPIQRMVQEQKAGYRTIEGEEAKVNDLELSALGGIEAARKGEIKMGSGGPDLRLNHTGQIERTEVRKRDTGSDPLEAVDKVKKPHGERDMAGKKAQRGDAMESYPEQITAYERAMAKPKVDREAALRPLTAKEINDSEPTYKQKVSGGNMEVVSDKEQLLKAPLTAEEAARRKATMEALRGLDAESSYTR